MSLWKGKKDDKKDKEDYEFHEPNPSGPALNNSCPKSVKLKIKFEEFGYPMYFPSCVPESWSVVQRCVAIEDVYYAHCTCSVCVCVCVW